MREDHAKENYYFYDTETTPLENYKRDGRVDVWLWGQIDFLGQKKHGRDIHGLYNAIFNQIDNSIAWFHNLKFDFSFLESFMLNCGYPEFETEPNQYDKNFYSLDPHGFYVLRNGMGQIFSVTMFNRQHKIIHLYDSAKVYPLTISQLGKMYGHEKLSEQYDYEKYRTVGDYANDKELEYMFRDISIMREAINDMSVRFNGYIGRTASGMAYKEMVSLYAFPDKPTKVAIQDFKKAEKIFNKDFPVTSVGDSQWLQPAYSGGCVIINPKYLNKKVGAGLTIDVNSLYPYVLQNKMFPKGMGEYFTGKYEEDANKPLYVQHFKAKFHIKENAFWSLPKSFTKLPLIKDSRDLQNEELILTNIDLKHFFINYDVEKIEYMDGVKWEQTFAPFKGIVDVEGERKVQASLSGDKAKRQMAKLMMNSCYGKLGENVVDMEKYGYLGIDGTVKYRFSQPILNEKHFMPGAIFTTAWARDTLFNGIYKVGVDRFLYCDTDSIHILGHEIPTDLPLDENKLGYFKVESYFSEAKFLRDKTYMEVQTLAPEYYVSKEDVAKNVEDYEFDEFGKAKVKFSDIKVSVKIGIEKSISGRGAFQIKGAGLTDTAKSTIKSIKGFGYKTYEGQLKAKQVPGGTVLIPGVTKIQQAPYSLPESMKNYWGYDTNDN